MKDRLFAPRPLSVSIFVALFVVAALLMLCLGFSASAYYYSALALMVQAILLWNAYQWKLFSSILIVNQISGLVLILVLGLGAGLGDIKLDISGIALLINVFLGGPLMSLLAIPLLFALHRGKSINLWFQQGSSRERL